MKVHILGIITYSLVDVLFSKTQQRVLGMLYGQPNRSFYLNEILQYAAVGCGTVQRELERLTGAGLLMVKKIGNQYHYQANTGCPIYEELIAIVSKTVGLVDVLLEALASLQNKIKLAFIFGSVAQGKERITSDVDVFIAGKITFYKAVQALSETHKQLGREINPVVMSVKDFQTKATSRDRFVTRVVSEPKLFLIGSDDDIRELVKDRAT